MRKITFAEAVREALREEMLRDENVFLIGEDIGRYGGAFGVTAGLVDEFGESRVIDTPISETAYVGAALGSALTGMRPVAELMFSDFMAVCFDQIANQMAKAAYMSGGKMRAPMVLRTPQGGGTGAAAQHSQTLESIYAHIPGLKVAVPSNAYDAKGLLKTAIRSDDPVIFLETKRLYREEGEVPEDEYLIPFGKAAVKREGNDVSVITWGGDVGMCLEAAGLLACQGIDAEVVDLRTLAPFDKETVINSVKKTKKCIVVHEAVKTGGFGGEVVAAICESEAFYHLNAPIKRIGAEDCPVPFSKVLEAAVLPTCEKVVAEVLEMMQKY